MGIVFIFALESICEIMFIKQIKKKNTSNGKTFLQYQLTQAARLNGKSKHISILYLGSHKILEDEHNRKLAAAVMKSKINGQKHLYNELENKAPVELMKLCDQWYEKYLVKHRDSDEIIQSAYDPSARYEEVDINSIRVSHCREIGAEWLCYNTAKQLGVGNFLQKLGWKQGDVDLALISLISRAVLAASEHKTEHWLAGNSGLLELFGEEPPTVNRYQLYKMSTLLHQVKDRLTEFLYDKTTDMFSLQDKILIYDLTNTYFEGRKQGSNLARYGRSKEKRSDCKLVVLGAVVNQYGFLKASKIYQGNKADSNTLKEIIEQMGTSKGEKKTVVIDAGIATEKNLKWLREESIPYICVSRKKLKDYEAAVARGVTTIKDKRKNKIMLKIIGNEQTGEQWMYVKSKQKALKENSMQEKLQARFEEQLEEIKSAVQKKGGTKKLEKVWERIGRLKERNTRVHSRYDIKVVPREGKAIDITWKIKPAAVSPSEGVYFIRTNYDVKDEKKLWSIYNTIREVESVFRCLKTDLNLRPVFHQKDKYVEAHLSLGLIAYQLVAAIRHQLKQNNINHDWRNIVRIMNTQKIVTIEQRAKTKNISVRTCSQPIDEVSAIYKATGIASTPFKKRKFVVYH